MKLNNKGFAISSIMYIILVLAVILISLILVTLSSRKLILDKLREEVLTTIYDAPNITYRQTIKQLKNEVVSYMTSNSLEKESIKIDELDSSIDEEVLEKYKLDDKYLTAVQNLDSYDVYLGKEKTVTSTSLPKNTLDIIDYKIYGNVYQKTSTQGKNLFDKNKAVIGKGTAIKENGVLYSAETLFTTDYIHVVAGKTYSLNWNTVKWWCLYDENKEFTGYNTKRSFTASSDGYIRITALLEELDTFQFEEGSASTEYEEFVPNMPSIEYPSEIKNVGDLVTDENDLNYGKYKILVKTSSKNLFNGYDYINKNFNASINNNILSFTDNQNAADNPIYINTDISNVSQVTCFLRIRRPGKYVILIFEYTDGTSENKVLYENDEFVNHTITSDANKTIKQIRVNYNHGLPLEIDLSVSQIEEGNEATEYEPYVDPVKTNIYLNEPLRKVFDYNDSVEFKNQSVVRNSGMLKIDNNTNFIVYNSKNNGYVSVNVLISDAKQTVNKAVISNNLQDCFNWETWEGVKEGVSLGSNGHYAQFSLKKERLQTEDVDGVKKFFSNNESIIQYMLETPIEETVELPKINSSIGATQISIDTSVLPSDYEFTVVEKIIEI